MRRHRLMATTILTLVCSSLLLSACATGRVAYHKPGAVVAERQRDQAHCTWASADDPDHGHLGLVYRIDRDAYARCMIARGYTPLEAPRP